MGVNFWYECELFVTLLLIVFDLLMSACLGTIVCNRYDKQTMQVKYLAVTQGTTGVGCIVDLR